MPTPLPQDVEIQFYYAIGAVMIRWGYIDALLATICSGLFEEFGGHSSHKKPPRNLSKRLDFIGKCFRNKPTLAHMAEDVESICNSVRGIDTHRNFFVHGAITEYFPEDHAYQFTKLDTKPHGDGYDQFSTRLTHLELTQIVQASQQVVFGLGNVLSQMRELLRSEKGQ